MRESPKKKPRTQFIPPHSLEFPRYVSQQQQQQQSEGNTPLGAQPLLPSASSSSHSDIPSPLFSSPYGRTATSRSMPSSAGSSDTQSAAAGPAAGTPARMLNRVREESEGVTTLKLPRGNVTNNSPSRSASTTTSSWASMDASGPGTTGGFPGATARSPDSRPSTALNLNYAPQPPPPPLSAMVALGGVGLVEFLEEDERPTFVVDLSQPLTTNSGHLSLLYVNRALKQSDRLARLVRPPMPVDGSRVDDANSDFDHFKAWISGAISKGQASSDGSRTTPWVSYGGVTWTYITLRKRYRVVSARSAVPDSTASAVSGSTASAASPGLVIANEVSGLTVTASLGLINANEASGMNTPLGPADMDAASPDYFGDVRGLTLRDEGTNLEADAPSPMDQAMEPVEEVLLSDIQIPKESFDWTRIPLSPTTPLHIQFARLRNWADTALGPVETWSYDLRAMANMIMACPHPAAMYWGPELTVMYNEAYLDLAGEKHPQLMGQTYREAWAEIYDELEPHLQNALENGQATMKQEDRLFVNRHGFLEETYFSWSLIPLVGNDGSVVGIYNPAFENTKRRVGERRMLTLREINERTASARDVKRFWGQVKLALQYNEWDVPFAMIYSVTDEPPESEASSVVSSSVSQPPLVALEATIGVPDDHPAALPFLDLRTSEDGFAPYMRDSMANGGTTVVLSRDTGTLPSHLVENLIVPGRGFGDPVRNVVVFPVRPTTGGEQVVVGFVVVGTNPRRPYNEDYQLFVRLLSRQLATSLASVVLLEEEVKRNEKAARLAALDRQELSKQLDQRIQEAAEMETRFTRMAEFSPVGMFIANQDGRITYCNEKWWAISGHPRSHETLNTWMDSIRDEDRPGVEAAWSRLVHGHDTIAHEFRFKHACRHEDGQAMDTWVLLGAYPEIDRSDRLVGIFGCITDISSQKWAEQLEKQQCEEAVELKRQQENFIDITSHEMRNPLSAVLQCADEIVGNLSQLRLAEDAASSTQSDASNRLSLALESCIEAANTITLCVSHQKRIVDDILTLSKLDSQLLLVTPVDARPIQVVQRVIKMFASELEQNRVQLDFRIERGYRDMGIDKVKLDPSRLMQVLINLMTNAIRFTQSRDKRSILITLDASTTISDETRTTYLPVDRPTQGDMTDKPEWGNGDHIFLHFSITDTGQGLDDHERSLLFQRFSGTGPRTHVQYGGSGLGLVVSRVLTELQGGQIGVSSQKGVGSTFSFYIRSRLVVDPPHGSRGASTPTQASTSFSGLPGPTSSSIMHTTGLALDLPLDSTAADLTSTTTTAADAAGATASLPEATVAALAISSTPGQASPERVRRLSIVSQRSSSTAAASSQQAAVMPVMTQPLDILVVEDNTVNQLVLQRQLRNCGNRTQVANHGGEALDALRRSRYWLAATAAKAAAGAATAAGGTAPMAAAEPEGGGGGGGTENISVILMDLEMPVMDGLTCARRIRELERQGVIVRHIPIIAVTAYARPEQIASAKAAGIVCFSAPCPCRAVVLLTVVQDDVVVKPFRIPELIPKIEELVAKYSSETEVSV